MLQFLDAVWQITIQFPAAFEFNERYLLHIANSLTSGLYGTFLYDSMLIRNTANLPVRTVSVWTPILQSPELFQNEHFAQVNAPIWPWTGHQALKLWSNYYFQWHPKYSECRWLSTLSRYGPNFLHSLSHNDDTESHD